MNIGEVQALVVQENHSKAKRLFNYFKNIIDKVLNLNVRTQPRKKKLIEQFLEGNSEQNFGFHNLFFQILCSSPCRHKYYCLSQLLTPFKEFYYIFLIFTCTNLLSTEKTRDFPVQQAFSFY